MFPSRWCFGKPVTQCFFGPCSNISSLLACATVRDFQQACQQNFGIVGKPCASYALRSGPGKNELCPKRGYPPSAEPLERESKRAKTSGYRRCYESNQRFIISSAALIRMTVAYCHCFMLVSRCNILTRSNQTRLPSPVGGVWTETSHWLRPPQLSHVSIIEPSCGTSSLQDRGVHA